VEQIYSLAPQAEVRKALRPGLLLRNVARLYREQFLSWFGITVPTSLVAAAVLLIADQQVKSIYRSLPRGEAQIHWAAVAGATGLRFGSFVVSWLLGCVALGAIASVVSRLDETGGETAWKHDSHQSVRDNLGALVLVGLFTLSLYGAGMAAAGLVEVAGMRVVGWSRFSRLLLARH